MLMGAGGLVIRVITGLGIAALKLDLPQAPVSTTWVTGGSAIEDSIDQGKNVEKLSRRRMPVLTTLEMDGTAIVGITDLGHLA